MTIAAPPDTSGGGSCMSQGPQKITFMTGNSWETMGSSNSLRFLTFGGIPAQLPFKTFWDKRNQLEVERQTSALKLPQAWST